MKKFNNGQLFLNFFLLCLFFIFLTSSKELAISYSRIFFSIQKPSKFFVGFFIWAEILNVTYFTQTWFQVKKLWCHKLRKCCQNWNFNISPYFQSIYYNTQFYRSTLKHIKNTLTKVSKYFGPSFPGTFILEERKNSTKQWNHKKTLYV